MFKRSLVNYGILLCFFFSGATGLIYEVIWAKYLTLFIGNTTYTHTIVIATFMGGLALGSYLIGKFADRVERPLAFYAYLELSIALYAIIFPQLIVFLEGLYFSFLQGRELGTAVTVAAKLLLALGILLIPTLLMGGTLPMLSRVMARSYDQVGRSVSILYFINSLGGVAGTLVAGFVLIVTLGLSGTIYFGAIANTLLGLLALSIDFAQRSDRSTEQREEHVTEQKEVTNNENSAPLSNTLINLAIAGIFLSGFTSMIYELVWIRLFSAVLGSSTYSFSLMLAAFISGLAIGSLLISRWMPKRATAIWWFGLLEVAIAVGVMLSFPLYPRLYYYFLNLLSIFSPTEIGYWGFQLSKYFLCFFIMFVPTIAFGATLPLISTLCNTEFSRLARQIGNIYSINTLGTLFGAFLTGLLLIPVVGLKGSLQIGIVLNLIIGLVIMAMPMANRPARSIFTLIAALVLVAGFFGLTRSWQPLAFIDQNYTRSEVPKGDFASFLKRRQEIYKLLYYNEDTNANVAVFNFDHRLISLSTNGKIDGSTGMDDMYTQVLLGQFPMFMHPDPKQVLVVGLGTGVTVGSILTHPVEQLECVEITKGVIDAAHYFKDVNLNVMEDKRMKIRIDDAKSVLKTSNKNYDVIVSEPSNVWRAGIGNLFSTEYFQECRNHLNPGGVMAQWIQVYHMDNETLKVILRTFKEVFPYIYIFHTLDDFILVGSPTPITPNFPAWETRLQQQQIKSILARINITSLTHLLGFQIVGPDTVDRLTREDGPVNSDYFPYLEYKAPKAQFMESYADLFQKNDERFAIHSELFLTRYIKEHEPDAQELVQLLALMIRDERNDRRFANALFDDLNQRKDLSLETRFRLVEQAFQLSRSDDGLRLLEQLIVEQPNNVELLNAYGRESFTRAKNHYNILSKPDFDTALKALERCADLAVEKKDYFLTQLADSYLSAGRPLDARKTYERALTFRRTNPGAADNERLSDQILIDRINVLQ